MDRDRAQFMVRIHEALFSARSQSSTTQPGTFSMSISSIASPPPVRIVEPTPPKAPDVKADTDADDARGVQPTVLAPLPPGQGTRVNQIA